MPAVSLQPRVGNSAPRTACGPPGTEGNLAARLFQTIMKRLIDLIGMSVGSWLGWTVGAWISFFAAFIVGVIGMGAGLYLARQLNQRLLS